MEPKALSNQDAMPPSSPAVEDSRFRRFAEASPLGMHLYLLTGDDQLVFMGANPAADRILGVPNAQFIGKTLEDAFPPMAGSELAARYREVARNGGTWTATEVTYEHEEIAGAFEVTAFQIAPREMVALFRDVTAERRNERLLERYRAHLEDLVEQLTREFQLAQDELRRKERLATLGQLTASVAHELRNPLGVLRTAFFSLRQAVERSDPKRLERTLDISERTILRIDHIITGLLDFTRRRPLQPEATDLDPWLDALLDEHDLGPEVFCHRELASALTVPMDRHQIRSAVVNLLDNACQAMADLEHGARRLVVGTRAVDAEVELWVADSGPGIPEPLRQRVLEPLFSTKSFGVGLGLAIVKQVADAHGGSLAIGGEPGQGAIVRLRLPLTPPPRAEDAPSTPPDPHGDPDAGSPGTPEAAS